ncbi:DUF1559 domain-containing protein [Thalassoglobus sp. JC818]|uniref:DUF1559 domain-containing protein n=1 Tax=Thalassoglobus sp. JC818 TaxID=3232136 RepID=UPI00345A86E9
MSLPRQLNLNGLVLAICAMGIAVGWTYAQRAGGSVSPENLLPYQSIIFARSNGSALTSESFKQTACYKAFFESGLMNKIEEAFDSLPGSIPNEEQIDEAIAHIEENGFSLGITVGPTMQPWGVVVVHDWAEGASILSQFIEMIPEADLDFQQVEQRGRSITMAMIPDTPVELGWWEEQGHLMFAIGLDAIRSAIAVADGEQPNILENPLYEKYVTSDQDFTSTSLGWFDFEPLREMFGRMPIPLPNQQLTINEILEILGLDNFDHAVANSGYKGEAMWSEQHVEISGEPSGLMKLLMQKPFTLQDLPPIPVGQTSLVAASFDLADAYDTAWMMIDKVAEIAPPGEMDSFYEDYADLQQELGFEIRDLLAAIGNIHCLYSDANQGLFGLGGAVLMSVNDAPQLRENLKKLADRAAIESRGKFSTVDVEKRGRTLTILRFHEAPFLTPSFCIEDEWVAIGLVPQAVESFLMRLDGDLPSWSPSAEQASALAEVPTEITSLSIIDPRDTYRLIMGFAPMLVGVAELGIRESGAFDPDFQLPISPADIPPSETLLEALFPNVTVTTVNETGWQGYVRESMPGIPFLGGGNAGTTVATSAVLVALLLPAVQQAREAARRTQSRNNLRQIGLGMHNYHDTHGGFPQGTIPNEDLKVEERLSWLVSILPFVDQFGLYDDFDLESKWNSEENEFLVDIPIQVYVMPGEEGWQDGYGTTSYVGMAGVGEDGPNLPVNSPRAGIFAYNRQTRIRDIHDGTSNTIAVGETTKAEPWAAGGQPTIRPLDRQPYINGGNGFGSHFNGGAQFLFADGSVRFISENIDPDVMEALSTIRGGEVVGDF